MGVNCRQFWQKYAKGGRTNASIPCDTLRQWLEENKDRELIIRKEEDGQENRITIRLQDIDMVQHHDTDDYLSDQALLLQGPGTVRTDEGLEPLPADAFEISLTDKWSARSDHRKLQLITERADYSIELNKLSF